MAGGERRVGGGGGASEGGGGEGEGDMKVLVVGRREGQLKEGR